MSDPHDAVTQAEAAASFLATQQITERACEKCGTMIAGVNGRYACGGCGWSNHWSEGLTQLPTSGDDSTR
ncbi:hypothetical protein ABII15_00295 [Streptomyces sp. HUAS MG91]|uniref:Uncharacterized protein n=1 Tax=Streptomyces tabacisoli TaxID=3156398 RepID=A0AAU8IJS6_9ACTN